MAKANCNECGSENSVSLIITRKGIFSKCEVCGYTEWEWAIGDNPDYLNYLAKRFKIPVERIIAKLEEVNSYDL